jgi:uncharacterized membrane protein
MTTPPKDYAMTSTDTVIATFTQHYEAENAIKALSEAGFAMQDLTIVGKAYHTNEKVTGFYNTGDRVKFWGERGAFWGGIWGLLFGGVLLTVPVLGHVIVLGYLASIVVGGLEGSVIIGAASALSAALFSIGIPKDSIIDYETVVQADGFLVMAHGTAEAMERAKAILGTAKPKALHLHTRQKTAALA